MLRHVLCDSKAQKSEFQRARLSSHNSLDYRSSTCWNAQFQRSDYVMFDLLEIMDVGMVSLYCSLDFKNLLVHLSVDRTEWFEYNFIGLSFKPLSVSGILHASISG